MSLGEGDPRNGPTVLGIETSCDETAAAVVAGDAVLANVVASQAEYHQRFGGVVPEVAARRHAEHVVPVVQAALETARVGWRELDGVAVTRGPGLIGALLVGVAAAKGFAMAHDLQLVGVHHLVGHVWSVSLRGLDGGVGPAHPPQLPALCLLVSGGHTELFHLPEPRELVLLGQTRDDAAGEAFDKVARRLGLSYPGGPELAALADEGSATAVDFPRPALDTGDLDFSFSGLKTAVQYYIQSVEDTGAKPSRADVAASFQAAVVDVLAAKTLQALNEVPARELHLVGGVAANRALRRRFEALARERRLTLRVPPPVLCTDNAAMIAGAGAARVQRGDVDDLELEAEANASIEPHEL